MLGLVVLWHKVLLSIHALILLHVYGILLVNIVGIFMVILICFGMGSSLIPLHLLFSLPLLNTSGLVIQDWTVAQLPLLMFVGGAQSCIQGCLLT